MGTDWPGVGATIRFISPPTNCDCREIYTPKNDAPPWYLFQWSGGGSHIWWNWAKEARYAAYTPDTSMCSWSWKFQIFSPPETFEIFMNLYRDPPKTGTLFSEMILSHDTAVQFSSVRFARDMTAIDLDPLPRNTGLGWHADEWESVVNFPIDMGVPPFRMNAVPKACIPGWQWGDPIPTP